MYSKVGVAPLSEHQVRRLIKGQGVSIKSGSKHELPMSKEQMKKFERAKKAGRGMVITLDPYQQQMCGGKMSGSGFFEDIRPATDFLKPLAEASLDRAIKEVGRGMKPKKGKGLLEDLGRAFQPVSDVFRPSGEAEQLGREVARELIYKGLPLAGSTLAGSAGAMSGNPLAPILFGVAGQKAGEELAKEVGRKSGIKKGKGMALAKTKKVAKDVVSKAKSKAKELVSQYLDLGEEKAQEMIGSGSLGGNKKKMGGAMRRMKGRALLPA